MLPIDEIAELLGEIAPDKKISFDKNYANALYKSYITKDVDDSESIAKLRKIFANQTVLLIAPGKSSETEKAAILAYIQDNPQTIAVSIAHIYENVNYIFMSNRRRHIAFLEQKTAETPPLICTSNLHVAEDERTFIVNYKDYLCEDEPIESNAGMMSINLMCKLGVRKLILAGFDGSGYKTNSTAVESSAIDMPRYEKINTAISKHLRTINPKPIFLTKSIYQL
ncbi:MAG: hypothetical protein FWG64_00540, partial [Firmicutes bacterium]|nr:hypothetical protein [Bacillota bacterium]